MRLRALNKQLKIHVHEEADPMSHPALDAKKRLEGILQQVHERGR